MLTESEKAQMAAIRAEVMTEQAVIVRIESVPDGAGGTIEDEQRTESPCFRYPNRTGATELAVAGQLTQGLLWTIGFPLGTDVRSDDRIEVGNDSYSVVALLGPYTHETARLVLARPR